MSFSTIAAIATPHGIGGVAIVRISGAESFDIAQRIFRPRSGKALSDYAPRIQIYGDILSSQDGEILDDGLLTKFAAPNSFTGEDVVEISCHGGEQITAMVLSAVLENGAVLAERGEFSRRSFLSGKMTLTSAEGIADLLDAKTSEAARLSSAAARGKLSQHLTKLSERVLALSASLWAYIDYPEEDLQTLSDEEMILSIEEILSDANRLLQTYRTGKAIQNGVKTVIIGKPNVGKSTFFNAFLGEKKAIVTDIPGTTRDILEYPVKCGKVLLNLMDSAGVRDNTGDAIEKMGMELVFEALEDAELVFALFDSSEKLDDNDRIVMEKLQAKSNLLPIIPIMTKCDKKTVIDPNQIGAFSEPIRVNDGGIWNFDEIVERVESLFISDQRALREGAVITNARQKSYLVNAIGLLQEAKENIAIGSKDIASLDLENALAALRELDGQSAGEEILNEVFSRFCIGK